jgi:hypothetical protein
MSRSTYIISYWPKDNLPWYVSHRAYDELGLPVLGRTLARCRNKETATRLVDGYMAK